jgi:hypothetical protein
MLVSVPVSVSVLLVVLLSPTFERMRANELYQHANDPIAPARRRSTCRPSCRPSCRRAPPPSSASTRCVASATAACCDHREGKKTRSMEHHSPITNVRIAMDYYASRWCWNEGALVASCSVGAGRVGFSVLCRPMRRRFGRTGIESHRPHRDDDDSTRKVRHKKKSRRRCNDRLQEIGAALADGRIGRLRERVHARRRVRCARDRPTDKQDVRRAGSRTNDER